MHYSPRRTAQGAQSVSPYSSLPKSISNIGAGDVAFDASSNAGAQGHLSLTFTFTHTPVGTPSAVGVGIFYWNAAQSNITGITYGGQAMTLEGSQLDANGDRASLYSLASPPAGAQDVVITFDAAGDFGTFLRAGCISVTGSDPLDAFRGVAVTATGNTNQPTVDCPSAVGDLVMDSVGAGAGILPGAGQTERWNDANSGGGVGASSTQAGAASVTMSWDRAAGASVWAIVAGSFKKAP